MIDHDIVALSPASVCRVLKAVGPLERQGDGWSSNGQGYRQPQPGHRHWHVDVVHVNPPVFVAPHGTGRRRPFAI